MTKKNKRIIAIHLPQFHPFKENNEWWGKGFTEWTNVAQARPRYRGHYQPHIPADLGFYDLRLEETRIAQADLAREYGIHGFCYYHYWFNGKLLMERPLEEILKSKKPDFPFMICWANENWTRIWDGKNRNVLMEQNYNEQDDLVHIQYLMPFLKDERYIKIDNKPVIAIYKSYLIPDPNKMIETWQNEAKKHGIELYIIKFEVDKQSGKEKLLDFNAAAEFQPFCYNGYKYALFRRAINKGFELLGLDTYLPTHINYQEYVNHQIKKQCNTDYKRFPSVTPMWDNSPRRKGKAYISFKKSTPDLYKKWLSNVLKKFIPYSEEENLVFINAWNEWAEGNHLEPDLKYGRQYLEATKDAINKNK